MTFSKYWFVLCLLLLFSCSSPEKQEVIPAFYHWKSNLNLSKPEQTWLNDCQVQKLYVRFFDVDRTDAGQVEALAQLSADTSGLAGLQIIPTVFITNRTLLNSTEDQVQDLAKKIVDKIHQLWIFSGTITEIQLDCDWSGQSRAAYFLLLQFVRNKWAGPINISATIRLHQIKYAARTGVPPVDRGMLMCYNTGDIKDWDTENSILDRKTLRAYLDNVDHYPLPLDVALPGFRWGILFRDRQLIKIINGLEKKELADTDYFQQINNSRFSVQRSTYLHGHYLYPADEIRLESISSELLNETSQLLKSRISNQTIALSLYHLDEKQLSYYKKEEIKSLFYAK